MHAPHPNWNSRSYTALLEVHTEGKRHLLPVFACCDWRTVTEILLAVFAALVFRQLAKIQNTHVQISAGGMLNDSFSLLLREYNSSAFFNQKAPHEPGEFWNFCSGLTPFSRIRVLFWIQCSSRRPVALAGTPTRAREPSEAHLHALRSGAKNVTHQMRARVCLWVTR